MHQLVPAVTAQVDIVTVDALDESHEVLVVVNEHIGVGAGQRAPRNPVQGAIALAQGVDLGDPGPEVTLHVLVTAGQQIDIIQHPIAAIVLHVHQARTLGLDPHVDVLGHQADEGAGVLRLQAQGHVDDAVVVGLVLGRVEIGNVAGIAEQLVRVDGEGAQRPFQVTARDGYPFLNLPGRGSVDHLVDDLDRYPGLAADGLLVPVLDVIQLLQHGHGDHDVVFIEGGDSVGVVQQDIGVQDIGFLDNGFQGGFFYAQGRA